MVRRPLKERPLDAFYVAFFSIHIATTLFVDVQTVLPEKWRLASSSNLLAWYMNKYNDPIVGGVMNQWLPYDSHSWTWLKCFFWLEILFQFPMFIAGIINLQNDNPKVYPYLLVYGASTITTVLPVIATLFAKPSGLAALPGLQMSIAERNMNVANNVPFLLVPLIMTVDMASRLNMMISSAPSQQRAALRSSVAKVAKTN